MKISRNRKSVLKIIVCLSLTLALMSGLALSVFATITTTEYESYTLTTYQNEAIQPYHLWLGNGGDLIYRYENNSVFYNYFFDNFFITSILRDNSGNISTIQVKFSDYIKYEIRGSFSNFVVYKYNLNESEVSFLLSKNSYCDFDWSKAIVSTDIGIEKGETFTYLDHAGNEKTITFDGNGGIVGYGASDVPEEDNPFGDLTEEEYPDFSLPEFQGKDISEYVDFDSIIDSIKGLDVAGAVQGLLGALKGGFKFTVDSVVNVVGYLTSTLKALFDWLKNTLPVLFNNFLVKLSPYFENLYNAIKDSPVGETLTDLTELYSKLDDLKAGLISVLPEPVQNVINSIPDKISETKEKIEEKIGTVVSGLESLKDKVEEKIKSINDEIKDIPGKIDDLKEYFGSLFDTSEVDISARIDDVKEYVFLKIPLLSTLSGFYNDMSSILSSTSNRTAPVITFPTSEVFGGEDVTVSLEPLRPVTVITDVIIIAACYILTLVYSIRAIPNILGGIGSGSSTLTNAFNTTYVSDHENQSKFGKFKDFDM